MTLNFQDFQKQDVKFDIDKLQKAYKEILSIIYLVAIVIKNGMKILGVSLPNKM